MVYNKRHGLVPRRVEGNLDDGFPDARHCLDLVLDVGGDDAAHAAARRGQRHVDLDDLLAVAGVLHLAAIDQAEVDDVDGYLGVVAGLELLPDQPLDVLVGGVLGQLRLPERFLAERVGVLAGDARQLSAEIDGERAAQRLGHLHRGAFGNDHAIAGGNHHRLHVAGQLYRFTGMKHVPAPFIRW